MDEKFSKKEVDYGPGHRDSKCGLCKHFRPRRSSTEDSRCEIVAGVIRADDWCNKFEHR